MKLTRREWIGGVAAGMVMPGALSRAFAEEAGMPLIVDTHQHLWDLTKVKPPWLATAPEVYRQSYRPEEYAAATKGLDVRTVYMEVDVAPADRAAEAEHVVGLCKAKSGAMRAAVIGGDPAAAGFEDYVKRFAATGVVKGVRQVLHGEGTPAGTCLKDEFVAGVRALGKLGLCFDLCMRVPELGDGRRLSELAPDTRFVVDHCGNADPKAFGPAVAGVKPDHEVDPWKRDMEALAKRPNVICKISGIMVRAPEKWSAETLAPIVDHCLDTFGPDRVVFGGDWPVCLARAPLRSWVDALGQIVAKRPEGERRQLWSENARKFYGLEG